VHQPNSAGLFFFCSSFFSLPPRSGLYDCIGEVVSLSRVIRRLLRLRSVPHFRNIWFVCLWRYYLFAALKCRLCHLQNC
jgi:hypothetical protein